MNSSDGAIGISSLIRILRKRVQWIVLGIVLGLVGAGAYIFFVPTTYTGTAEVNITAVSAQPLTEGKAASSLVDLSTERQLAASSNTATLAAEYLGAGWSTGQLMQGVTVSGDPDGTVLRISYSDTNEERAIQGADNLARAYLEVRTSLAKERISNVVSSIDKQIADNERELEGLNQAGVYDSASSVRAETLRSDIQSLQERRSTWNDVSVQAGQVITPASANPVRTEPIWWRVVALGFAGGFFLGLILVLIRQAVARRPSGPEEIELLLDSPVWRPVGKVGTPGRWDLAAEQVRHANRKNDSLAILVDWPVADGKAATEALADVIVATIIDTNNERAQILRALSGLSTAVLVVPMNWSKSELTEFVADLESVDVSLLGVIVVEPGEASTP
jgi:hypothetical protein